MGDISFSRRSELRQIPIGGKLVIVIGTLSMSSSYATSGDSYTPVTFGLDRVLHVSHGSDGTYIFVPDIDNSKILAYDALGSEVSSTTNLSTYNYEALIVGSK